MQTKEYRIVIGGKEITARFTDLANQANGSVILSCEDTVVLATAVMSKDGKNNPGFFNLTVEYLEKYYAAGLILGGQYNKREGRPSDEAILSARLIDRTIRPFFESHIKNAVQVVVTVLSVGRSDPGILGINAASLALSVSDIPWNGPVGAVHVGTLKGGAGISVDAYQPNNGESPYDFDMTVCGKDGKIAMIEALSFERKEEIVGEAFDIAIPEITKLEMWQKEITKEMGKVKINIPKPEASPELISLWKETIEPKLKDGVFSAESKFFINETESAWVALVGEKYPENEEVLNIAKDLYHHRVDVLMHEGALNDGKRVDGRSFDEVRSLYAEVGGISPLLHGTGIFYRGETHVMSFLTLDGPEAMYELDGMEVRGSKRFMHHYNFPPYSVGETGRFGGINRREMGHGFLAEKALIPVIPEKEHFPYTIRLVSECMASNGSTSQASICASTLALMDGGVPIKAPVAGISVGLMLDEKDESNYRLLTDIQGPEDHHGDMDFKIGGTKDGITAIQLDIKVGGIPVPILKDALVKAKVARLHILETIEKTIPSPRKDISVHAPKILLMTIKQDQIGLVIGSGGKTVKNIKEVTGAEITIEEDGTVYLTGKNGAAEKAKQMVESIVKEWKVGESAQGIVEKVLEIGAVVKISEHADGLVHISEIAPFRVGKVSDFLHTGMQVPVKIIAVDKERDKISLSIKQADPSFIKQPAHGNEIPPTPHQ